MTRSTNDAKARQWQQHFDSFDKCDLSVRKFCTQHRLSIHSLQ
ncbi:MAG: IS66 family insertion sequence element accessory protein TnpA [Pirellula staleyi]